MKHCPKLAILCALTTSVLCAIAVPAYAASSDQTGSTRQPATIQQHRARKKQHQKQALEAHGGARAEHNMKAVGHGERENDLKQGENVPPANPDED
jgi:hypothetical protein